MSAPSEMQVKREDLNPCTVLLTISCSSDQVRAAFDKAYRDLGKRVKLPGFRPGHAPKAILQKALGKEDVMNAAAEVLVQKAYNDALTQIELKPEGQAAVEIKSLNEEENSCEFLAKVPLAPIVELAEYKGIEVEQPSLAVTDEDVDRQIDEFRKRGGKREAVKGRGAHEGDMAVVNIKEKGDSGEGRTFMTSVGQTFEALDKALLGMEAEEMKTLTLDFPDNFQEKDWAGTKKDVDLTVRSISTLNLPELDDSFAKQLQADDVKDLREKVREGLERAKAQVADEIVNEQILTKIVESSKIEVADNTWETVLNQRLRDIQMELQQEKKSIEDHVKANGMTVEEFVERLKNEAQLHVKRAVVIERVFQAEGLQITDQVATGQFMQIAAENNIPVNELENFAKKYGQALRDEVIYRSMYALTTAKLRESATVVEAGATKPAKKAAAKKADAPADGEAAKKPAAEKKATKPKTKKAE